MNTSLPSAAEVARQLSRLSNQQLQRLAELSGVPFTTLWKIRASETANPRLDTVGQFLPHVSAALAEPVKAA